MPQLIAKDLEQLAKNTGCKQSDIVRIGISEINKLNDDELTSKLIEYKIY